MAPRYHARIASIDVYRQAQRSGARADRLDGIRPITSTAVASAVTRRLKTQIRCQPSSALGALTDASSAPSDAARPSPRHERD